MKRRWLVAWVGAAALAAFGAPRVTPDYFNLTVPPNIAPLNMNVSGARLRAATLTASDGAVLAARIEADHGVRWPRVPWKNFLASHTGETVCVTLETDAGRVVGTNRIATLPIDGYLTYRAIPPGYSFFYAMKILQRNLATFDVRTLYGNTQVNRKQCVNCHIYNRGDERQYVFHTRKVADGTCVVSPKWGKRRLNLDTRVSFSSGTYPDWHPSGDFIAFSVNETRQQFYLAGLDFIEVFDGRSDLIVYDLAADCVIPVETSYPVFETFPAWSPDGRQLYSSRVELPFGKGVSPGGLEDRLMHIRPYLNRLYYNIVVRDFDPATRRFSEPRTVVDLAASEVSAGRVRISPDGRWLVFGVGPHGQFHNNHKSGDLWMADLATHAVRPLDEINSPEADSYMGFSSNGRWAVFTSRREDGSHMRPYFAAFDPATGRFSKPFILPMEDPAAHERDMFSYNIPELTRGPLRESSVELRRLVTGPLTPVR